MPSLPTDIKLLGRTLDQEKLSKLSRIQRRLAVVNIIAFAALVSVTVAVPSPLWFDEQVYLEYVDLVKEHGISMDYVRAINAPAGPLYGVIHYAFEPLTGLQTPYVRFVTIGFFVTWGMGIGLLLRRLEFSCPWLLASSSLAAPMIWGTAGTAMTEPFAYTFQTLGLALLVGSFKTSRSLTCTLQGLLAGFVLGVSVLGRQMLVLMGLTLPMLIRSSRAWQTLACLMSFGLISLALFCAWGGATAPNARDVGSGVVPLYGLVAIGYSGLIYGVFEWRWLIERPWISIASIAAGTLLVLIGGREFMPLQTIANGLLPKTLIMPTRITLVGIITGIGILFAVHLAKISIDTQATAETRWAAATTVLMLLSHVLITHHFAGRYALSVLPFLFVIAAPRIQFTNWLVARVAIAELAGLASLISYHINCYRYAP